VCGSFFSQRLVFPRPSSAGQNVKTSGQQVTPSSEPERKGDPKDRDRATGLQALRLSFFKGRERHPTECESKREIDRFAGSQKVLQFLRCRAAIPRNWISHGSENAVNSLTSLVLEVETWLIHSLHSLFTSGSFAILVFVYFMCLTSGAFSFIVRSSLQACTGFGLVYVTESLYSCCLESK